MNKILLFLFPVIACYLHASAQLLPKEGSMLSYRLISFSPYTDKHIEPCTIQVASGIQNTPVEFAHHVIKTVACKKEKVLIEVPSFGKDYTWRTVTVSGQKKEYGSLHHFATTTADVVDPKQYRLRVTRPAADHKGALVWMDGNAALYNLQGQPVWYFPEQLKELSKNIRDLKISPAGTITFISGDDAYEINYDGDILWKAPNDGVVSGDQKEHYHHEFTRLANGNYMVLGNEVASVQMQAPGNMPAPVQGNVPIQGNMPVAAAMPADGKIPSVKMPLGTLIEYDAKGNVLWSWKSSSYIKNSDLAYYMPKGGAVADIHENGFFFDEQDKAIYISFKNISRIVKIKYPEGTVLNEYGEKYKPGSPFEGNGLFCNQHACKRSSLGCLFLFNNNGCNMGVGPKVKILEEPKHPGEELKKIWEYNCATATDFPKEAPSGGNVVEMPDGSIFVSVGGSYGKVFIVNRQKQIEWSAVAEHWNESEHKWQPVPQYRASVIADHKLLERLVVNNIRSSSDRQGSLQNIAAK